MLYKPFHFLDFQLGDSVLLLTLLELFGQLIVSLFLVFDGLLPLLQVLAVALLLIFDLLLNRLFSLLKTSQLLLIHF